LNSIFQLRWGVLNGYEEADLVDLEAGKLLKVSASVIERCRCQRLTSNEERGTSGSDRFPEFC